MAIQDTLDVDKWLVEHKDLWENNSEGYFVILSEDLSDIPQEVINYFKVLNSTMDDFDQSVGIMNKMSNK